MQQQQPTPPQNEIAAKFAAQVAATLKTPGSSSSPSQDALDQYEHTQLPVQMVEQPIVMPMNHPPPLLPPVQDQTSNSDPIIFLGDSEVPDETVHPKLDIDMDTDARVVTEAQVLPDIIMSEPSIDSLGAQVNVHQTVNVSETRDSEPRELKEKSPPSDETSTTDYADLQASQSVKIAEYEYGDINTEKSSVSPTDSSSNHNVQGRTTELEHVSSVSVDKIETEPAVLSSNLLSKECSPEHENSDSVLPVQSPPQSQSPPPPPPSPPVVPEVPATTATPIVTTVTISLTSTSTTVASMPVSISTATVTTPTTMSAASGEPANDVICK